MTMPSAKLHFYPSFDNNQKSTGSRTSNYKSQHFWLQKNYQIYSHIFNLGKSWWFWHTICCSTAVGNINSNMMSNFKDELASLERIQEEFLFCYNMQRKNLVPRICYSLGQVNCPFRFSSSFSPFLFLAGRESFGVLLWPIMTVTHHEYVIYPARDSIRWRHYWV